MKKKNNTEKFIDLQEKYKQIFLQINQVYGNKNLNEILDAVKK